MPRIAVSEDEMKDRILRGSIKNAKELQGIEISKLSKLTGIPESTLYAKIRAPSCFTVRELRLVFKALRYPTEEKERIGRDSI